MATLSRRFSRAFAFARKAHAGQVRKGTAVPYISHPMAVASIVLEYGGGEDQAVAALLHDTIEDCGATEAGLARRFGAKAARIVRDCSDSSTRPKPPWRQRKERYLERLAGEHGRDSLLVSAADKLHNARAIVRDVSRHGAKAWRRFSAEPREILWYYEGLVKAFRKRRKQLPAAFGRLVEELARAVGEMRRLALAARRDKG